MALTSPRLATLNRLNQGAIPARAWASVRLVMTVSRRAKSRYVCRPTYYEGRHTDMQLIFQSMAKASDSKGKTLAAAAKLFRQQGYHGTALHDILEAGGSPRGSLYFHFPKGKEEIGEAAVKLAGEAVARAIAHAAETSENAEVFLTRVARGMASDLERSDYREGCPIATTALETAAQSEVLGAATRNAFKLS